MRFVCPLIATRDMAAARYFYEHILGQKVKYDFGENVTFQGDFALHQADHFQHLLGDPERFPMHWGAHTGELYFECEEVDEICARLQAAGIPFIHGLREQPWGQRVLRCYDPDGHIVEIGESLEVVVGRYLQRGMSIEEVAQRTSMPQAFVNSVAISLAAAGLILGSANSLPVTSHVSG